MAGRMSQLESDAVRNPVRIYRGSWQRRRTANSGVFKRIGFTAEQGGLGRLAPMACVSAGQCPGKVWVSFMARKRKEITEILVEMGALKPANAEKAQTEARKLNRQIEQVLVETNLVSEEDVTKAMAIQYDMEYIDLNKNFMQASDFRLLPADVIKRHQVLPLGEENGKLRIVIADPNDLETLEALRFRLNKPLETCLAVKSEIKRHIDRMFAAEQKSIDDMVRQMSLDRGQSIDVSLQKDKEGDEAPIIRLVSAIVTEACKARASDIHIEPMKDRMRVRYRVDGVCAERDNLNKKMQNSVIARLKIMAGMDIAERRLPQDGRIKMAIDGANIDFRVSSLPAYHGESMVLRILRPDNVKIGMTDSANTDLYAATGASLHIVSYGWPLFLSFGVTAVGQSIDRLLLAHYLGVAVLGPYGVVADILRQSFTVLGEAIILSLVTVAKQHANAGDRDATDKTLLTAFNACLAAATLGAAFFVVFGDVVLGALLKPEFVAPTRGLLPLFAVGFAFMVMRSFYFGQVIYFSNASFLELVVSLLALVASMALSLTLVPDLGVRGAAIALMLRLVLLLDVDPAGFELEGLVGLVVDAVVPLPR